MVVVRNQAAAIIGVRLLRSPQHATADQQSSSNVMASSLHLHSSGLRIATLYSLAHGTTEKNMHRLHESKHGSRRANNDYIAEAREEKGTQSHRQRGRMKERGGGGSKAVRQPKTNNRS
jgi:hypothetical protein